MSGVDSLAHSILTELHGKGEAAKEKKRLAEVK
jgi:hypothetical protein